MPPEVRFEIDASAADAVGEGSRLLCLVPGPDDDLSRTAFEGCLDLARETESTVVLYDRSEETWADTDHSGSVSVDDIDFEDAPDLASAVAAAHRVQVPVEVWRSTMPALATGMLSAIQRSDIDVLVLPQEEGTERLVADQVAGDSAAGAIFQILDEPLASEAGADVPVIVVTKDCEIRLFDR